jgi:hypothetical protein
VACYPAGVWPRWAPDVDAIEEDPVREVPGDFTPPPTSASAKGPDHYISMEIAPWDVVDTWPIEQRIGFYRGNLLKYTMRMGAKDAREKEIEKARHYAEKLTEVLKCQET